MYEDVESVLTGHTTQENAFMQEDYPWGRRLRCERRTWVETASKGAKKGQQRFMAQTRNPKTERWCKPKPSTYSDIIVMYLNGDEHVKIACLGGWDNAEKVASFVEMFGEHLTEAQWASVRFLGACNRVSEKITWKIAEPGEDVQSPEEQRKTLSAMVAQELRAAQPA